MITMSLVAFYAWILGALLIGFLGGAFIAYVASSERFRKK